MDVCPKGLEIEKYAGTYCAKRTAFLRNVDGNQMLIVTTTGKTQESCCDRD